MVKFGKYLVANQVSEWSTQYIRYKKLKKTIKQIAAQKKERQSTQPLQTADAEAFALSSAVWAAHHLDASRERRECSSAYSDHGGSDVENQLDHVRDEGEEQKSDALRPRSLSALKGALDDAHVSASPPVPSVLARSSSCDGDDSDQQHQEHRRSLARINSLVHVMGPSALNLYKPALSSRGSPGSLPSRRLRTEPGSEIEMGAVAAAVTTESEIEALGAAVPSAVSSSPATIPPSPISASGSLSLRSVLPSALRADTYERIFFEIVEEDLLRINAFFLEMEKNFMEKLDVISKQISAFLEAETDSAPVLHPAAAHGDAAGDVRSSPAPNPHGSHFSSAYKLRSKASRAKTKVALSKALRELYRGLNLLKNFRILNFTGVVKILKKHDKISDWKLGGEVLPIVQQSYFFASPVLESFLERVEAMYVGAFAAGDRRKGMDVLRPSTPPLSAWLLFGLGFTAGLCLILVCILTGLLVWSTRFTSPPLLPSSAIAIAPIFRCLFLLLLAVWLWALLVCAYQKHQLNFTFILETDHTFLRVPQILSVACKGSLLYFSCLDVYLLLLLLKEQAIRQAAAHPEDPSLQDSMFMRVQPEWVHGALWLALLVVTLCPLRIFYYSTRKYLLTVLRNVFTTPLTTVSFRDFFVADWICSLVSVFGDLSYTLCFYGTGSFHDNERTQCADVNARYILWFVSFIPNWWRFGQSLRRYRDTASQRHLWNATKYFIGALVTLASLLDKKFGGPDSGWRALWICTAIVGTLVSFLWDILFDWGLWSGVLDRNSSDKLLRPKLTLEHRWIYHVSIWANLLLRVVWVLTISPAYTPAFIAADVKQWVLYTLELLRRAQWSYYRLENEHLNNAGQFRAVNICPIPMDVMDDEEVAEKLTQSRAPTAAALMNDPDVRQRIVISRQNSVLRRGLGASAAGIHVENGHLVISAGKGGRSSMYARARSLPDAVSEIESEDGEHVPSKASLDGGGSGSKDADKQDNRSQDTLRLHLQPQPHTPPQSPHALSSEAASASPPPQSARLRPPQQPDSATGVAAASSARRTSVSQQSDFIVVAAADSSSDPTSSDGSDDEQDERRQLPAALQLQRTPSQDKFARKKARRDKRRKRIEAAAANADDGLPASHDLHRDDSSSSGSAFRSTRPDSGSARLHRTLSGRSLPFPRPVKSISRNSSNTRLDQLGSARAEAGTIDEADAETDTAASQAAAPSTSSALSSASGLSGPSAFTRPPSASNRPLAHDSAERIRCALSEESEVAAASHRAHAQLHTVTESSADQGRTSTPPN